MKQTILRLCALTLLLCMLFTTAACNPLTSVTPSQSSFSTVVIPSDASSSSSSSSDEPASSSSSSSSDEPASSSSSSSSNEPASSSSSSSSDEPASSSSSSSSNEPASSSSSSSSEPASGSSSTASSTSGGAVEPTPDTSGKLLLGMNGISDYKLVYGTNISTTVRDAFLAKYNAATGTTLTAVASASATYDASEKLILLGDTKYTESTTAKQGMRNQDWIITYTSNKLVITGYATLDTPINTFANSLADLVTVTESGTIEMLFSEQKSNHSYTWDSILVAGKDLKDFTIVYGTACYSTTTTLNTFLAEKNKEAAQALQTELSQKYGYTLPLKSDAETTPSKNEILVGLTNRVESITAKATLSTYGSFRGWNTMTYAVYNGKLCIYAFISNDVVSYWLEQVERSQLPTTDPLYKKIYANRDAPRAYGIVRTQTFWADVMEEFGLPSDAKTIQMNTGDATYRDVIMEDGIERHDGTEVRIMSANIESECWLGGTDKTETNLRWKYWLSTESRAMALMHTIESYKPDVIGLQEVSMSWHDTLQNYALVGSDYAFYANGKPSNVTGTENNGTEVTKNYCPILYNKKTVKLLTGNRFLLYTDNNNTYARILTTICFEVIATGEKFVVINTHWDNLRSGYETTDTANRLSQAKQMAEKIGEMYATYKNIFALGDFNTRDVVRDSASQPITSTTESHGYLSDAPYQAFLAEAGCKTAGMYDTYWAVPAEKRYNASWIGSVDHIFCSKEATPLQFIRSNYKAQQEVASDHAAIMVDFTLG